jgi:hypothetical protein
MRIAPSYCAKDALFEMAGKYQSAEVLYATSRLSAAQPVLPQWLVARIACLRPVHDVGAALG